MKSTRSKMAIFVIMAVGVLAGCHSSGGQVPPSNPGVTLTWTTPSGCTAVNACTYTISAIVTTGSCPTPNVASPNYTVVIAGVTALTYLDTSNQGKTVCYIGQTVQSSAVSQPSNTAGPFVVPAVPTAPAISGVVAAANADSIRPMMPKPTEVASTKGYGTNQIVPNFSGEITK